MKESYKNSTAFSGVSENFFMYRGKQFDLESGNYYLRARYYSPISASFISVDPFVGDVANPISLNKYLYGNGNPVMFSDPSGNMGIGESMATIAIAGILATLPTPVYAKVNSEYWLEFIDSRDKLTLYTGRYKNKKNSILLSSFIATSGHRDFKQLFNTRPPAFPLTKYRSTPSDSPIPIGDYYSNIHEAGEVKPISVYYAMNDPYAWELSAAINGGIQSIPNIGDRVDTWGEYRVRIFAKGGTKNFGRDNFYFHGITYRTFKSYGTSGCIGVLNNITRLVDNFRNYRKKSKKNKIKVNIR